MTKRRAKVIVSGHVQNVWFRHFTGQAAEQQGVKGWVRNNPEGTVEAVFEGEENAVRTVIDWCRRGPDMARVDSVHIVWQKECDEFDCFSILT